MNAIYTGCVYIATNLKNGKIYIGKTTYGLIARKAGHASSAKRGVGSVFCCALRKYGADGFSWAELFFSDDEKTLYDAEISLIADYKLSGFTLYNMSTGGDGPTGIVRTTEQREAIRQRMLGSRMPPEAIEKMRQSKTGKSLPPWSDARRAKHAATWAKKIEGGYTPSSSQIEKMRATKKANMTDEVRERMRQNGRLGAAARWGSPDKD